MQVEAPFQTNPDQSVILSTVQKISAIKAIQVNGIATIILLVLGLMGCSSIPSGQDPKIKWKLDAKIMVNGTVYNGTGVIPKKSRYDIEIYPRSKIDMAFITTCHRDKQINATEIKKFLGSERQFKYTYEPRGEGLEDESCPMFFNVLDKDKVTSLRAMIDFQSAKFQLPAQIDCDGDRDNAVGVGICQGKEKLMQRITFKEDVRVLNPPACGLRQTTGRVFFFEPLEGECGLVFEGLDSGEFLRLTISGYEATFTEEMAQ